MLRTVLATLLALSFAIPARADEPPGDEPMHNQPAPSSEPAQTAPPAPAAAPAAPAPAAAPAAPAQVAPARAATSDAIPKVGPDGMIEEIIPNPPRVYGYAFGGAALGCILVGSILGGVALSRSHEQQGSTSMPPVYTSALMDRGTAGGNMGTASYVFFAAGAALAVTDIVLWYETFRKPRVVKRTPEGASVGGRP